MKPLNSSSKRFAARALALGAVLTILVFMGHTLFSAYAAFTNLNFLFSDYGVYTNTTWNIGRGNGFQFLVDHSYLKTHLSFSLAALAPLYYLFDTPALLLFVQWGFMAGGLAFLAALMRHQGLPALLCLSIMACWAAHPYSQSVLLSEFHGVSAYLLLIPWLAYGLLTRRNSAWIPFLLILGLREDAGFYLPFFCGFFAYASGRRTGYCMAAVALFYSLVAILLLYPAINGVSLFDVRSQEVSSSWSGGATAVRLRATAWLLLPVLPVIWLAPKGWKALLACAGLPWLITMMSGYSRQYGLGFHYPAVILAALFSSIPLALARAPGAKLERRASLAAALLLILVFAAHTGKGFFLGGARQDPVYLQTGDRGRMLQQLADDIPKEGLLLADQWQAVFGANREEVVTWRYWKPRRQKPEWILCRLGELNEFKADFLRQGLKEGSWGIYVSRFPYYVLQRGADPTANEALLQALQNRRLAGSAMPGHLQLDRQAGEAGLVRHWPGERAAYPQTSAFGKPRTLEAGTWQVEFTYRAGAPRWPDKTETGWFSLHQAGRDEPLAREAVTVSDQNKQGAFTTQTLRIELKEPARIEARMTGACAPLWLRHIDFISS